MEKTAIESKRCNNSISSRLTGNLVIQEIILKTQSLGDDQTANPEQHKD